MKCTSCGANMKGRKCEYCGHVSADLFCKKCGEPLDKDWTMCPECGLRLDGQNSAAAVNITYNQYQNYTADNTASYNNPNLLNKWVAFILCFCAGVVGAHKFYEGNIKMGVIYLLTCGLIGMGVVVDLIVILCRPTYYRV